LRFGWLGVLLIVATLLVPTGFASHNMGHRYLVHGRVLDSQGMPVQNQEIEIRLSRGGTYISSLFVRTDCLGDFDSWKAVREGPPGASTHGDGEIEGPFPVPGQQGVQYYNFHFHDEFLSSQNKFEFRMPNGTWEAGFNSRTRQTSSFHQLDSAMPASASCGGNFDQFNSTFEVRVFISLVSEMTSSGEPTPPPRTVSVVYGDAQSSGASDFVSTYVAKLQNVTGKAGDKVQIDGTTLGSKTVTISAEEAKFRRVDSINALGGTGAPSFGWLKTFGIIALVVIVLVGVYYGSQKFRAKREQERLMQGSTRRRFRKNRGGPGGET
jgi:hypothetical protein